MNKLPLIVLLLLATSAFSQNSSQYEKAWTSLNDNKRAEAGTLLQDAEKNPESFDDAYISKIYLTTYNGKEESIDDFDKTFYSKSKNPYPYIYALWFNPSVLGASGKKQYERQIKLADRIIADEKAPGTIVASANYQRALHHLFSNDFGKTERYYNQVGSIRNWQYVGPFENLSQSGFFKNFGPLEHPEPDASFKSLSNADVKWIVPAVECKDGWTPTCYQFNARTAVVYAQNFVNSPVDQTIYCNVGGTGSIKVWINDELVISEVKERITELDVYTVAYTLKKGVNRVLVQLGYTNSSFPNFCVRITDEKFRAIPGITGSSTYAPYPKASQSKTYTLVPHFAEAFFQEKIAKQPDNLVNYLLLADVYLRNQKVTEARNLIADGLKKAPGNCLLKMKMVEILIKEDNRTQLLEEIESIKQADPESVLVMDMRIREFFDNQKYEDGSAELEKRIQVHGEDLTTAAYKILLLLHDKKYDELVKEVETVFEKYPDNSQFIESMYAIKKEVYKDNKAAMKVYENYMKNNYDYNIYERYASLLGEQGNDNKALEVRKKLADDFPYSPDGYYKLSQYHYTAKQYDKAEEYVKKALALSPYNEVLWEQMGDIKSERKNQKEALEAYNQSLKYDPNQYNIINKIRKLNGKSELYKLIPETDITKLIKADVQAEAKNTDYGYYFILDQKDVIVYPGGATEQYVTSVVRITNEKGVDRYKESSISYGSSQNLLIEKAEVIKKSQAKIEGERNGNEVVFTNLEVGDVVVFKYRLQSFVYGRFGKEFWDKFYFNGQIYSAAVKYSILAPAEVKIDYLVTNSTLKPEIKDVENFKQYSWQMLKPEPEKEESLMPVLTDVAPVLHISTIPTWKEIADWYSDICNNKAFNNFSSGFSVIFLEGISRITAPNKLFGKLAKGR